VEAGQRAAVLRLTLLLGFAGCAARDLPSGAEAWSFTGAALVADPMPDDVRRERERQLDEARAAAEAAPDDPDALLWLGRRTAYLGRYRESIAIFTTGVERFPDDARFLRHRGHRWLTTRHVDEAIGDLERAAALEEGRPDVIEPDGQPNAAGLATSTLQGNVWYHLALARYVAGDFDGAADGWRRSLGLARTDDMRMACTYWYWLALRRADMPAAAAALLAAADLDAPIVENFAYRDLLLLFRGTTSREQIAARIEAAEDVERATLRYGAAWHDLLAGDRARGEAELEQTVAEGPWPAFGCLAAEADLANGP
jgi:tetratricopeptide (TPR) repeat protein